MNSLASCQFGVKLTEENSGASNGRFFVWSTWLAVGTTSTGALFQKSRGGAVCVREFLWLPVFSNTSVGGLVESISPVMWRPCRLQSLATACKWLRRFCNDTRVCRGPRDSKLKNGRGLDVGNGHLGEG